ASFPCTTLFRSPHQAEVDLAGDRGAGGRHFEEGAVPQADSRQVAAAVLGGESELVEQGRQAREGVVGVGGLGGGAVARGGAAAPLAARLDGAGARVRSEEHTSELQSRENLV